VARDFYEVLGVPTDATPEQVQQAYRRLARRYHPDVNKDPAAEERFKEVSEAYEVLSDPDTRRRYDRFGPDFRRIPEDVDERMSRGAGRSAGSRVHFGRGFGGIDFEDLLGGFGSWGGPVRGADQEAELDVSIEESYRGGTRRITVGSRDYDVTIPRGVVDGQRIRLAGQGGLGGGDAPAGDLYLVVRIAPHPRFRLSGRDITVDAPVTPWEAALGATVPVSTPDGETKVKVPPGSSSGRRLRLRGQGMPNPRGRAGDLYAEIKVMVPPRLTHRERELFEQLAAESTFDPRRQR
jgi:curved DNA-binding protein